MPRIFDNIDLNLLPILQQTLESSYRADFCVGYFNLRGWRHIAEMIDRYSGGLGNCCRLIIGMPIDSRHEINAIYNMRTQSRSYGDLGEIFIEKKTALQRKWDMAQELRTQLTRGFPTNEDEAGLQQLSRQIAEGKLVIKLFTAYPLHAKLYLAYRHDANNPITGFLGSSNLTISGLQKQGELNIDVLDHDACKKLQIWFNDRWKEFGCEDISQEIVEVIKHSWAREELIPPYHIYLKMAYHLSYEAIAGSNEFAIPAEFVDILFDFQKAAVQLAARHVTRRGGVVIGDVVGLGKTMVGAALMKIFDDDYHLSTLVICPKNLVNMWQGYVDRYGIRAKVMSISKVQKELSSLEHNYRLVLIDESHNLRNRGGKRYRAIADYINKNTCKCILLSATPYNKNYVDLSSQLRLFIADEIDLPIKPERLIRELGYGHGGEAEFHNKYNCGTHTLAAFEKSTYPDDWRDLINLYMVRRTRSFIKKNYTQEDDQQQERKYLEFADGRRSYFPDRIPKTIKFPLTETDPYAQLYSPEVVDVIGSLNLPRYGLANYKLPRPKQAPNESEKKQLENLSRAGKQLKGFSRTNLFKRLESSGIAFIQSLRSHILRNFVYLHALEHNLEIPIGAQDADLLRSQKQDEDLENVIDSFADNLEIDDLELEDNPLESAILPSPVAVLEASNRPEHTITNYSQQAQAIYQLYQEKYRNRFKWIRASLFDTKKLKRDLLSDAQALMNILEVCGEWQAKSDQKLLALINLVTKKHPQEKVLVFTQFADTVNYLVSSLQGRGIAQVDGVTGQSKDPNQLVTRFSPISNGKSGDRQIPPESQIRVLITTDVLSEGHNLQDCAVIVNYDLPWAIIRLIQRAGRVDRIGQNAAEIFCYSFLPAEGVDRIIKLHDRLLQRLQQNAEVIGSDEIFFEGENHQEYQQIALDLYHEKAGTLDEPEDNEVDLTSEAFQIWQQAIAQNPELEKIIKNLDNVTFSSRSHSPNLDQPEGVLLYMKTSSYNDALMWVDRAGNQVTQSQIAILKAAACSPDAPAISRHGLHHELVEVAKELVLEAEKKDGSKLGKSSGVQSKTYYRLKNYLQEFPLFASEDLKKAHDQMYKYRLQELAIDTLNRQLRIGINNQNLSELVLNLWKDNRLCILETDGAIEEPQIVCSLGLFM